MEEVIHDIRPAPTTIGEANSEAYKQIYPRLKLDTSRNDIRLLRLHPGQTGESLRCDLVVRSLDDRPHYHALSYVWGDVSIDRSMLYVGEVVLEIGRNLAAFLSRIRSSDEVLTLWTDAVCINQADEEEKSYQVPLMGAIYSRTTACWAWLGLQNEHTFMIPKLMQEFNEGKHIFETSIFEILENEVLSDAMNALRSHGQEDALRKALHAQSDDAAYVELTEQTLKRYVPFPRYFWSQPNNRFEFEILGDQRILGSLLEYQASSNDAALIEVLQSRFEDEEQLSKAERRLKTYECSTRSTWAQPSHDLVDACKSWCLNEYFHRIWTFQEICLPEEVELFWSGGSFDLECMIQGVRALYRTHVSCCLQPWGSAVVQSLAMVEEQEPNAEQEFESINKFFHHFTVTVTLLKEIDSRRLRIFREEPIVRVAAACADRVASQVHDYIYGILGLIEPALTLVINYQAPASEVFAETTYQTILSSKSLEILSYASGVHKQVLLIHDEDLLAGKPPTNLWTADLPSWVPDYTHLERGHTRSLQSRNDRGSHIFSASCRTSALVTHETPSSIGITGVNVDVVSQVYTFQARRARQLYGIKVDSQDELASYCQLASAQIDELADFINVHYSFQASGGTRAELIWRLYLQDRSPSTRYDTLTRATLADGEFFDRYLAFLHSPSKEIPVEFRNLLADTTAFHASDDYHIFYCVTSQGFFGVSEKKVQKGDEAWVLLGATVPHMIRPNMEDSVCRSRSLVAETYLHGWMDGRAIDEANGQYEECVLS